MLHIVTMFLLLLLCQDLTSSSVSSDGAWSLSRSIWKHTTTCQHTPATSTHTSHDMSTHTPAMSTHTSYNMTCQHTHQPCQHMPAMSKRNSHVMSTHTHTLVVSYDNTHTSLVMSIHSVMSTHQPCHVNALSHANTHQPCHVNIFSHVNTPTLPCHYNQPCQHKWRSNKIYNIYSEVIYNFFL